MPFLCVLPTVSSREYLKLGPHPTQRGSSQPEPISQPAAPSQQAGLQTPPRSSGIKLSQPSEAGLDQNFFKFFWAVFLLQILRENPNQAGFGLFFVNFAVPAGSFRASRRTHSPGPQGPTSTGVGSSQHLFLPSGWLGLPQEISGSSRNSLVSSGALASPDPLPSPARDRSPILFKPSSVAAGT